MSLGNNKPEVERGATCGWVPKLTSTENIESREEWRTEKNPGSGHVLTISELQHKYLTRPEYLTRRVESEHHDEADTRTGTMSEVGPGNGAVSCHGFEKGCRQGAPAHNGQYNWRWLPPRCAST